jgi:hypothetical protein
MICLLVAVAKDNGGGAIQFNTFSLEREPIGGGPEASALSHCARQ